jgi:hypothetical protein
LGRRHLLAEKGIALTAPSTQRWWVGDLVALVRADIMPWMIWQSSSSSGQSSPDGIHAAVPRQIDEAERMSTLLKMQPQFTVSEADAYYKM